MESGDKLIDYLDRVSKEPIIVNGSPFSGNRNDKVTIKQSFFLKDSCQMCGRCCLNETNAWTEEGIIRVNNVPDEEFDKFGLDAAARTELLSQIDEHVVNINGEDKIFYIRKADKNSVANRLSWVDRAEVTRCHWLFEKNGNHLCGIHPIRSVTCGMPHMRFLHVARNNHTSIGTYKYGRNFRLKCPVEFEGYDEEDIKSKILWLTRLNDVGNDLGVVTYLPEILDYLNSGGRREASFSADSHHKLISMGGIELGADKH